MWPDRRCHGDRRVHQIQRPALLHVQFDEHPDTVGQPRVFTEVLGIAADSNKRFCQRDSVVVAQSARPVGIQGAGRQLGSDARNSEARPLLVGECRDRHRDVGHHPALAQQVDGRERRDHAEWTVEGAAVGNGVQV